MKYKLKRRDQILALFICAVLVSFYLHRDRGSVIWRTNLHDGISAVISEHNGVLKVQGCDSKIYYLDRTTGKVISTQTPKSDVELKPGLSMIAKGYNFTTNGHLFYKSESMRKPLIYERRFLSSNCHFYDYPTYFKGYVYAPAQMDDIGNLVLIFKSGTLHVVGCANVDPGFSHAFDLAAAECDWEMSSPIADDRGIIYIGDATEQVYAIKPWFGKF